MEEKFIGKNWYLGETLHAGIGQGYWQSSPMQLCLMTAQIANGGYKINRELFQMRMKIINLVTLINLLRIESYFQTMLSIFMILFQNLSIKVYSGTQKILNLLLMHCMALRMNLVEPPMDQD